MACFYKNLAMKITIILLLISNLAIANELHGVLNGWSRHLSDGDYNKYNWGLGFEYHLRPIKNHYYFTLGGAFKDSVNNLSGYLGGGIRYRLLKTQKMHINYGMALCLMSRKDYHDRKPFLAVLPFVSFGTGRLSLNTTYVPSITPESSDLIYFQLMYRLYTKG